MLREKRSTILLDVKIKSNGHQVYDRTLKKQCLHDEIKYHLSSYKLPINIVITQAHLNNNCEPKISDIENNEECLYDTEVLMEQIQLFETQKQINDYLAIQKLLAHNVEDKLTYLSKKLIELLKQKLSENNLQQALKLQQIQQTNITKEKLNEIQEKCMKMLTRVQQERKKIELCVICWDKSSSVILIPCMHLVLCNFCPPPNNCPVCKEPIQKSSAIYR